MSSVRLKKHKKTRDSSAILIPTRSGQADKSRARAQDAEGRGLIWYHRRWILIVILFVSVVIVGAFLRLYQLDTLVTILNRDEAALAYNALMLEQLGRDEWGEPIGPTLRSFGDYKLIGYPALLVMLYKTFPVDDFTVRLPSVLAGIGIIVLSYPLVRVFRLSKSSGLLFSLIIALSPFAIFYSRFAYEANVALFYVLLALYLLLKPVDKTITSSHAELKSGDTVTLSRQSRDQGPVGKIVSYLSIRKRLVFDFLAIALLVLACFTYNSPLILFLPVIFVVAFSRIGKGWKNWLPLIIMGVTAWSGVVWTIFPVISQKSGISIMTDALVALQYVSYRQDLPSWLQPIIGSKYAYWLWLSTQNFIKSLSPDFLTYWIFHPWHGVPRWGQLLVPVAVMGWLGMVGLIWQTVKTVVDLLKNKSKKLSETQLSSFVLLFLVVISLLPAVITVDAPHATRSLLFLYLFTLTGVWALERVMVTLNSRLKLRYRPAIYYVVPTVFSTLIIISSAFYIHDLFGRYKVESNKIFQSGITDVLEKISKTGKVAILDKEGLDYIRWVWYSKLSPDQFLESVKRRPPTVVGLSFIDQVDRFYFIDWINNRQSDQIYLVQWNEENSSWEVLP